MNISNDLQGIVSLLSCFDVVLEFSIYFLFFVMSWILLINTLKLSTYFIFSVVFLSYAYVNGSIVYLN